MNKKYLYLFLAVLLLVIVGAGIFYLRTRSVDMDGIDTPPVNQNLNQGSSATETVQQVELDPSKYEKVVYQSDPAVENPFAINEPGYIEQVIEDEEVESNAVANNTVDSDSDTIPDTAEALYGTDPLKADTDGDGFSDADEIKNGYNPLGEGRCTVSTCIIN